MLGRLWRRFNLAIALGLGLAGAIFAASGLGFALEEELGLQWLFGLRGARPPPDEVVVVGLDRATLTRFRGLDPDVDRWPGPLRACERHWGGLSKLPTPVSADGLPRALYGCLIRELQRRGAEVIVFDIAFRNMPNREEGVATLASAARTHGAVIFLQQAVRTWLTEEGELSTATRADTLERPHPLLASAASGAAPFLLPKATSRINQFWVYATALSEPVQLPMKALEVRAAHAAQRRMNGQSALPYDSLMLEAMARMREARPYYYLNFYGPPGTIRSASIADILAPGIGQGAGAAFNDLRGKTVFVGYQELNVPDGRDTFPTVFRNRLGVDLSGVEIAATAFSNLAHAEVLRSLPEGLRIAFVLAIGSTLALASLVGTVWRGLVLCIAIAAAYTGAVLLAFTLFHFWLPIFVPLAVLLPLAIGAGQLAHYVGAARWLGIYTPRQVSRHLLKGEESLTAQPHRREVTVMMTDIVGFTTFAEQATPEQVTEFVNAHFTMLANIIEGERGVLAQFIGDSVMAFWGAPDEQPDHAARACRAAASIARALDAENRRRISDSQRPVRMRIGINTGEVTVGNVGAPGRSSYGVVGDTVNSTQRIEQLARHLCPDQPTVAVLVSSRTRMQAEAEFIFEDVGEHALRGRERTERVYRLKGQVTPL